MSAHTAWVVSLIIGLVAALIVAGLLTVLIRAVRDIESSVGSLLEVAGGVAANTAAIPQLEATAPVLGLIVEEAVVQDGYMNALTDGYGGVEAGMSTGSTQPSASQRVRSTAAPSARMSTSRERRLVEVAFGLTRRRDRMPEG